MARRSVSPVLGGLRRSLARARELMEDGYYTQAAEALEAFFSIASELEWHDGPELAEILDEGRRLAGELRGRISEIAIRGSYSLGARAEPPVGKIEGYIRRARDLMNQGYVASASQLLETIQQALWYWENTGHPEIRRLMEEARSLGRELESRPEMEGSTRKGETMPPFLSKEAMSSLMVTAWEGGSTYWVEYADYIPPKGMKLEELKKIAWENLPQKEKDFWKEEEGVPLYSMLPYLPPSVKWKIKFVPNEVVKEEGEKYYLTPENMREAALKIAKTHPHIFARIMSEDYDAGDADAWLQTAIFDEVIFG